MNLIKITDMKKQLKKKELKLGKQGKDGTPPVTCHKGFLQKNYYYKIKNETVD